MERDARQRRWRDGEGLNERTACSGGLYGMSNYCDSGACKALQYAPSDDGISDTLPL
jgi:hypothetical protein